MPRARLVGIPVFALLLPICLGPFRPDWPQRWAALPGNTVRVVCGVAQGFDLRTLDRHATGGGASGRASLRA